MASSASRHDHHQRPKSASMSPTRALVDPLLATAPELPQPCFLSCAAAPHASLRFDLVLNSSPFLLSQNQTDAGVASLRRLTCKSKHPAMKLTVPSIPNHEALNPESRRTSTLQLVPLMPKSPDSVSPHGPVLSAPCPLSPPALSLCLR